MDGIGTRKARGHYKLTGTYYEEAAETTFAEFNELAEFKVACVQMLAVLV
jgi:hypothetical protein